MQFGWLDHVPRHEVLRYNPRQYRLERFLLDRLEKKTKTCLDFFLNLPLPPCCILDCACQSNWTSFGIAPASLKICWFWLDNPRFLQRPIAAFINGKWEAGPRSLTYIGFHFVVYHTVIDSDSKAMSHRQWGIVKNTDENYPNVGMACRTSSWAVWACSWRLVKCLKAQIAGSVISSLSTACRMIWTRPSTPP